MNDGSLLTNEFGFLGTIAAAAQSGMGSVGAGSAFAIFQSAGAGGAGLAIINGAVQGVGAAIAGVGGIWSAKQVHSKSISESEAAASICENPSKLADKESFMEECNSEFVDVK